MQLSINFKNLDPSNAVETYVQKKLDKFDKLLDNPAEAQVVLFVEKRRHIAEITLISDRLHINAKETTESMYSTIDKLMDKVSKQIKKQKEKLTDRRHGHGPRKPSNTLVDEKFSESETKNTSDESS